jgi:hypothetical protein
VGTVRIAFVTVLVAAGLSAAVPTPDSYFGHKIGADRTVLDWDRVVSYFRVLERGSDRLRVSELGKTGFGRPFVSVTISSPKTLRNLDRYRRIQARLAEPRITPETEAERLAHEGKAVVMITCSIHANEIASTHTSIELAYRLLTGDTPRVRAILDNTIFLLVPSLNPDGLDIVTRWYRKTLGTPYEGTLPPELYNKYTGHDDNRDWYIFSQPETRLTIAQLHNVWHPQIVYDVHQQGPQASRMFIPPWMDPIEPNIDPLLAQECNWIGMGMAADLTAAGKKGVVVNALYDFWTPARHYQAYHGGMRILSESASVRIASPVVERPDQIAASALGYNPREPSWNYLEPWNGGEWRLRDIIDYQLIAMESCLYQAAVHREDLLRNFYRIGKHAVERKAPYAFVLPAAQRDPGAARKLLETLSFGMVEIDRAAKPFTAADKAYDAGSYVIRLSQPYGSFAKTLLERQHYPDLRLYPGGPPKRPYDVTAHTLPLLMGVDVDTVTQPFSADLSRAGRFPFALAGIKPAPGGLAASDTDTWKTVNRFWREGKTVWRDPVSGDFYTRPDSAAGLVEVRQPRIALFKSFMPEIDEGWTRWLLDEFGFAYASAGTRDIQAGRLRDRFDAIIFADQPASSISMGFRPGSMPDEYTGGLGEAGAAALREFAYAGGTLIFLNRSTAYAPGALKLRLQNALADVTNLDFYSPGSLLNVHLDDAASPLHFGLPSEIAIWSEQSPAWDTGDVPGVRAVARYPEKDVLASGWLLGEKYVAGKAAVLEVGMGAGRAVLFGMRPQYRAQSYQSFKLFFNALLRSSFAPRPCNASTAAPR